MSFRLNLGNDFKDKVSFDNSLKIASKGSRDSLLDEFINCYNESAMLAPAQRFDWDKLQEDLYSMFVAVCDKKFNAFDNLQEYCSASEMARISSENKSGSKKFHLRLTSVFEDPAGPVDPANRDMRSLSDLYFSTVKTYLFFNIWSAQMGEYKLAACSKNTCNTLFKPVLSIHKYCSNACKTSINMKRMRDRRKQAEIQNSISV